MKERLQKFMAHAGIASRRACEQIIQEQRVTVNGKTATLGMQVDPKRDEVKVDGRSIKKIERKRYLILNKPTKCVTTAKDQFGRKSVIDLLDNVAERVYPVGRLDYDSEGLLLLTNDGSLAHRVMHPKFELRKTYIVQIDGEISHASLVQLRRGVELDDGPTMPAEVTVISRERDYSVLRIVIAEGRNRQVRRMCAAVGHDVKRLMRTEIGPLKIGKLKPGEYRDLTAQEVGKLKQAVSIKWRNK